MILGLGERRGRPPAPRPARALASARAMKD
jgi:hypothetical protein